MSPSSVLTSFLTLGRFFNLDLFPVCHLAILFSCTLFVGKIGDDMGKAPPEQHRALSRMHQLQGQGCFPGAAADMLAGLATFRGS